MAIFQREGGETPSSQATHGGGVTPSPAGKQTTVVAAGSRVTGEISGSTDVLIDGQLEGQLMLGSSVVVGEAGEVAGQIQARRVKVGGKVRGDIHASERIEVLASGRIEGDVSAPRVAINAGAFFKGKVDMTSEKGQGQTPAKPGGSAETASRPAPEAARGSTPAAAKS